MSKLDEIKPTGMDGLYKTELLVEGEWISLQLLSKESILRICDSLITLSDRDLEATL